MICGVRRRLLPSIPSNLFSQSFRRTGPVKYAKKTRAKNTNKKIHFCAQFVQFFSFYFVGFLVVLFALLMAGLTQHMPYASACSSAGSECCAIAAPACSCFCLCFFCFCCSSPPLFSFLLLCSLCVCLASIMLLFIQQFSFCWPFNFR